MAWAVAAIVVIIVVVLVLRKKRLLTQAQFAEAVKQRIAQAHPGIHVLKADGLAFTISKDGKETGIYWDNAYAVYRNNPNFCSEIIDDFLKGMTSRPEPPQTWAEAKPKLMPSLRARVYLEEAKKLPGGAETVEKAVVLDYNEELCILIAIDSELTIAFATKDQLSQWGVSPEQALDVAIENLGKVTGPLWPDATETAHKYGIFAFNTLDGYDASRVLLPDFYQRASQALESDRIVVGVPNRDYVVAMSVDNPVLGKHIEKIKKDFADYDHPISPNLIHLPQAETN